MDGWIENVLAHHPMPAAWTRVPALRFVFRDGSLYLFSNLTVAAEIVVPGHTQPPPIAFLKHMLQQK
jgi:hypothetical protein